MSRYIDRDAVRRAIQEYCFSPKEITPDGIAKVVMSVPTVDVVEVRHGSWDFEVKHFFDDYGDLSVYAKGYCSECGKDYPFNATIASEFIEKPDDLIGYAHWDIDVEPIKAQVAQKARTNKKLYPFCPTCGAKMDGERREE